MDQFVISPDICLGDSPAILTSFIVLLILDYRPLSNFNQKGHKRPHFNLAVSVPLFHLPNP
jgi:hypothetical protein